MSHLALGLMSGTSADGVSAALGRFKDRSFELLGHTTHAYPADLVKLVRQGPTLTANQVSSLNMALGHEFASTANRLLKKLHVQPRDVTCIGSHGQTIYHGPRDHTPNTLQLADPAVIAEQTGISVVSNFRQRDIAVGGEGAPLIPFFDHYFYGNGPIRAFQNIGGIANVTVVGKGIHEPLAFDTGPGNCLMDMAVRIIDEGRTDYDHQGQRAKKGTLIMEALNSLMQTTYLRKPPPKSTGPELFNENFLKGFFEDALQTQPNDVLATLNQFTCLSIQEAYRNFVFNKHSVAEIVVSGGGVFNKTLMKKLECLFAPIPVKSVEEFGLPAQAKEPLAFGFFGLRRLLNKVNHMPNCTGAKKQVILGTITPA
jgi:anhydro-N-acetylmuramic acid kinase